MDRGEFDNLPGAGQPIDLAENSYEPPELRNVHRLLRNAGFAPAWIEERKDVEAQFQQAYSKLSRAKALYCLSGDFSNHHWQRAMKEFRECIEELNQRIRAYNLHAPAAGFHRTIIDADQVIDDLTNQP
jgi:hypothetical protein